MKKLLIIGLVAAGFAFASAPRSEAGVSVGIGFGGPFGYYPSYGCYPYGYYPYYRPAFYRVGYGRPYYGRSYYWSHGRRNYHARHRHWR